MIRFLMTLVTGTMVLGISMCSAQETPSVPSSSVPRITDPDAAETDLLELASGNSAFAFNLYKTIRNDNDDNIFFSPYSISAALAMTYAGAESITEIEMAEVLQFSLDEDPLHSSFNLLDQNLTAAAERDNTFSLHIVNALWGQTGYTFLPEFLEIIAANYGAGISLLNFSDNPELCCEVINEWVVEQTNGKIEDLIPRNILNSATRLVLTNAIYFKAQWLFQFDEMGTFDQPFHLIDGEQVTVPTMHQTEHFPMARGDGYIAAELPYSNRRMSMLVIVPDSNRFMEVEENLGNDFIDEVTSSLSESNLYLSMPKFETVSSFQLEDILSEMGMPSAFGMSADFSGMDGTFSLYIASVIHKAFVSVDEKGTEAAAATAVVMEKINGGSSIEFIVDRPFIYLIRDRETGTILFMGRILNPLD
jgi:serpin B